MEAPAIGRIRTTSESITLQI